MGAVQCYAAVCYLVPLCTISNPYVCKAEQDPNEQCQRYNHVPYLHFPGTTHAPPAECPQLAVHMSPHNSLPLPQQPQMPPCAACMVHERMGAWEHGCSAAFLHSSPCTHKTVYVECTTEATAQPPASHQPERSCGECAALPGVLCLLWLLGYEWGKSQLQVLPPIIEPEPLPLAQLQPLPQPQL